MINSDAMALSRGDAATQVIFSLAPVAASNTFASSCSSFQPMATMYCKVGQ
jgi:hypothetical protein